ncbi:MAG: LacI family DNA-binding transcriptional regulator [Spirochaetales bacterium]|nr:LacI family DNA-binding transcriptional regulator [Spirochaetales bacterium]
MAHNGQDDKRKTARLIDVALRAGVSRTTAAKVLLGTGGDHVRVGKAAIERVRKASTELQYRPNRAAQALRGAKTHTFGVLMDTVNAPVMNDRLAALENEADRRGYRLLIGQVHGDPALLEDYLADFDSYGVDAILCLFDLTPAHMTRTSSIIAGRRDIVFHGKASGPEHLCVRIDTAGAIRLLLEHLESIGRKRIGMELWNMDDKLMEIRRTAFLKIVRTHKHSSDPASMIWIAQSETPAPSPAITARGVDYLVEERKADAIIASNDIWAVRFIQELRRRGFQVPGEVAVTGYDNTDIATVIDPALTTIDQTHDRYAEASVNLLIAAAGHSEENASEQIITLTPELVIRDSTKVTRKRRNEEK